MTILYQTKNNSRVTNEVLCTALFAVYGEDFKFCGSTPGHLKRGHDNHPSGLKISASKIDFNEADKIFQKVQLH